MSNSRIVLVLPLLAAPCVAGDLTPPAGAPGSTMKTLQQVEPRTPINLQTTPGDADSVYRITQPGSYYLTSNLALDVPNAQKSMIEVAASNVTIDLNGFTISGLFQTGTRAVFASAHNLEHIVIRNGMIRDFPGGAIDFNENDGSVNARVGLVSHIQARNCGVGVKPGADFTITDCHFADVIHGVDAWGHVTIERTRVQDATGYGVLSVNGPTTIRDCSIANTGLDGVLITTGVLERVVVEQTGGDGIDCGNATVRECDISYVDGNGLHAGGQSTIEQNRIEVFMDAGIRVGANSRVVNNEIFGFQSNPGGVQYGVVAASGSAYIDGNSVQNVDTAITASVGRCVIVRNTMSAVTASISVTGSHTYGPIVPTAGQIATTSPWANFLTSY